jgi:hypothetical protein
LIKKYNLGKNLIPISEPRSITEVVESENSKLRKEIEELRKEQVKCKCQIKANPAPILKGDALDFQKFFLSNLKLNFSAIFYKIKSY